MYIEFFLFNEKIIYIMRKYLQINKTQFIIQNDNLAKKKN